MTPTVMTQGGWQKPVTIAGPRARHEPDPLVPLLVPLLLFVGACLALVLVLLLLP
jgi:hypothetical protein